MKREIKTLESAEFNELSNKTKQELKLTNPAAVLDALGLEYKEKNGRYEFKVRAENTASANMYIDNKGEWKYKDFGGGNNGTVENLVMDVKNATFKESLEFAIAHSGVRNYVQEKLDYLNGRNHTYKNLSVNNLEIKKQENISKVEAQINSKVTEIKEINGYKPAIEYLESRGLDINRLPKQFKMITGSYVNKDGEVKKAFGIGIESVGGGADIHFLKQIGSLKTMNFGSKNISHFLSQGEEPSKSCSVFESKFCFAAAAQHRDFSNTDVIIANSTANHLKVAEALKATKYEFIEFYQQNDKPGIEFVKKIVEAVEIKKFEYIKYKKSEAGQDINDLHKNGVNIEERKIQNRQQEQVQEVEKEKESFVEGLLEKLEHANDLIELAVDAKVIDKDNFIESLTEIPHADTKETLEIMNNTYFNDLKEGVQFVKSIANAAIEVIKKGDISLSGVTKAVIHELQERKLEKSYEKEI